MMSQSRVASTLGVLGLFAATLVLFAGPASACCTNHLCNFIISSSSKCPEVNMPVCNFFGCNCNLECGVFTMWKGHCHLLPCSTAAAVADTKARFDEIDTDHNDKISAAEAGTWAAKQKDWAKNVKTKDLRGAKDPLKAGFAEADKNHDGSITPAEFDSSLAE